MSRVWSLPFAVPDEVLERAARLRLLAFDVDGVLTDGAIGYGPDGGEYKSFSARDGQGIRLLAEAGIQTAIISARSSRALSIRARELGIDHVETGVRDKTLAFQDLIRRSARDARQCGYVGDDLLDIPVMLRCGLGIAVADAHYAARHVAHWVTPSAGGRGAVREVCDTVLYAQDRFDAIMDRFMSLSTAP